MMRAFIAIKLSDGIVAAISDAQRTLASANSDTKLVAPQNIHITLKFLGNIDEATGVGSPQDLERLANLIAPAIASFKTFNIEAYGMGSFPERGSPRVIWVGCRGDVAALKAIATLVEQYSKRVGIPEEDREFASHITIGRVKSNKNIAGLREKLATFSQTSFGSQAVAGFTLFKSDLRSEGPVYTALREFRLGT